MQPEVIIVLGVGIAVAVFWMLRERSGTPWADHSAGADKPDEVEVMGRTIFIEHLRETTHQMLDNGPPRTGYGVALPAVLSGAGIIDPEAQQRFAEASKYGNIVTNGHPETSDGLFDATFFLTESHRDSGGLDEPEVRAALMEVRDACSGVWVRDGKMWVIELGPFSASSAEVNGEYFAGILQRIEAALG